MWSDNPATAYVVLGLGNWGGGVAKGVTGFGSAIINLCCWIVFKCCGVASGTLQQAVVSEALASTFIAPGLLWVTNAPRTADFRIVIPIAFAVILSSPVGAAILARLEPKHVELVMACALLAIILSEYILAALRLLWRCARCGGGGGGGKGACAGGGAPPHAPEWGDGQDEEEAEEEGEEGQEAAAAGGDCEGGFAGKDQRGRCGGKAAWAGADFIAAHAAGGAGADAHEGAGGGAGAAEVVGRSCGGDGSSGASSSGSSSEAGLPGAGAAPRASDEAGAADAEVTIEAPDDGPSRPLLSPRTPGGGRRAGARGHDSSSRGWLWVLGVGSVAGTLSGIMEGLTGMNGPPIMMMYRALGTPKATVRGNNSFLNLLQFRLVPYYAMGLIRRQDFQLHALSCVCGAFGIVAGDLLSRRMGQAAFARALRALTVLCCALMFASGLGLVE